MTLKEESIIWSRIYPSILDKDRLAVFLWLPKLVRSSIKRFVLEMKGRNLKLMPIEDFIKAEGVIPQLQERFKDYLVGKEIDN